MFGLFKKNKSFTAKLVDYEQEFVVEPGDSLLTGALKAGLSCQKNAKQEAVEHANVKFLMAKQEQKLISLMC